MVSRAIIIRNPKRVEVPVDPLKILSGRSLRMENLSLRNMENLPTPNITTTEVEERTIALSRRTPTRNRTKSSKRTLGRTKHPRMIRALSLDPAARSVG